MLYVRQSKERENYTETGKRGKGVVTERERDGERKRERGKESGGKEVGEKEKSERVTPRSPTGYARLLIKSSFQIDVCNKF